MFTFAQRTSSSPLLRGAAHPAPVPFQPRGAAGAQAEEAAADEAAGRVAGGGRIARPAGPGAAPAGAARVAEAATRAGGAPLDAALRRDLEPRLGHSFSHVRVHADEAGARAAGALGARAFAFGEHLVFGRGQYAPGSERGRWLIAHELSHVLQQGEAPRVRLFPTTGEVDEGEEAEPLLAGAGPSVIAQGQRQGGGRQPRPARRRRRRCAPNSMHIDRVADQISGCVFSVSTRSQLWINTHLFDHGASRAITEGSATFAIEIRREGDTQPLYLPVRGRTHQAGLEGPFDLAPGRYYLQVIRQSGPAIEGDISWSLRPR